MLYHHSERDYNTAASEAAAEARRTKFEPLIEKATNQTTAVLEQIMGQIPQDKLVPGRALRFVPNPEGIYVHTPGNEDGWIEPVGIHPFAMRQVVEKAQPVLRSGKGEATVLGMDYINALTAKGDWGRELAAHTLNEIYAHSEKRHLLRAVKPPAGKLQVRGFLSDAYRRMDSRPLVEAFAAEAAKVGALPFDGYALDTKVELKAILPLIFEPVPNEVMMFGLSWSNSDFGDGAHTVRVFVLRLWCTNRTCLEDAMSQTHIGARINDNLRLSQRTYHLDQRTVISGLRDIVSQQFSAETINAYCGQIKAANEEAVDPKKALEVLRKRLTAGEAEKVTNLFKGADIENLPPGNTTYRMSNALSFFAQQVRQADPHRALQLEEVAGEWLAPKKAAKK